MELEKIVFSSCLLENDTNKVPFYTGHCGGCAMKVPCGIGNPSIRYQGKYKDLPLEILLPIYKVWHAQAIKIGKWL
jgi:hypothetical protein